MAGFRKFVFAVVAVAGWFGSGPEAQAQYQYPPPVYVDPNAVSYPILQTGVRLDGYLFDARTGRLSPITSGTTVYESFTDPLRRLAVPGTARYVDRLEIDVTGAPVRIQGWQWESVTGRPHGNLTRTRVTPDGGAHREQVFFKRQ